MTSEGLIRGFFILLTAGIVAYCSWFRAERELGEDGADAALPRYSNIYPVHILPEFMLLVMIGCTAYYGWRHSAQLLLSWSFSTFTHISLFYIVLLPLLPLFRRYFSARSCAELWMLPTLLYTLEHSFMSLPGPLLVAEVPRRVVDVLLAVWLLGCAAVFLWYIAVHIVFRRRALKNAVPITDEGR